MSGWGTALASARPRSADPGPRGLDDLVGRMNTVSLGANTTKTVIGHPTANGERGTLPWSTTEVRHDSGKVSPHRLITELAYRTRQAYALVCTLEPLHA